MNWAVKNGNNKKLQENGKMKQAMALQKAATLHYKPHTAEWKIQAFVLRI